MAPRSEAEKAERRLLAARKKEEREAKRKAKEEEEAAKASAEAARLAALAEKRGKVVEGPCLILELPEVCFESILKYLPARELACISLTVKQWNYSMAEARISYFMSQLSHTDLCEDQSEARRILKASYGGGDTKRVVTKKQRKQRGDCDEFPGYARFIEEGVCGYSKLSVTQGEEDIFLAPCLEGRYCSVSPEHSLTRIGGDGVKSGPGGSGVAAWGVGRRGQLGTGQREDLPDPKRLLGGFGYGIRIVQVSAGGGLVRVAHSLFLTSTGRVLSCGHGGHGQLGHGYSGGKQLPDYIRPKFIEAFNGMRIICVSAGEIHSAAVNSDGDIMTFGDGFLGMLGHGDKRPQVIPKQVEKGGIEDECVVNVACGARHTLVITEEGEVWSMGLGHYGVLGRSFTPYEYDAAAALDNLGGEDLEVDAGFAPIAAPRPIPRTAEDEDPVLRGIRERAELEAHLDLIANLTLDDPSDQCIPKKIDSLLGIKIVGASAGHRHSILLDEYGGVYTFGSGVTGALGHGDNMSQMYPMKVMEFEHEKIKIMQISAGVDMSMAVSTQGKVYSWGKSDGGRLGIGMNAGIVNIPRQVQLQSSTGEPMKAIDVECGYVHSLIVGIDGTLHICGGVGLNDAADGQQASADGERTGKPVQIKDLNVWHRLPEPREVVKTEKWVKYGKYELQGRSKMLGRN